MVDILADPEMVGFKRIKHIYQIIEQSRSLDTRSQKEDYRTPYRSSNAGCL
ncbi:MAG: hypothetical protein HY512_01845 [Candidatus Aenigmarchaeota archaeon]|nr:hypothetical protein [Candidatus Aenigmarchaeota archaeon]